MLASISNLLYEKRYEKEAIFIKLTIEALGRSLSSQLSPDWTQMAQRLLDRYMFSLPSNSFNHRRISLAAKWSQRILLLVEPAVSSCMECASRCGDPTWWECCVLGQSLNTHPFLVSWWAVWNNFPSFDVCNGSWRIIWIRRHRSYYVWVIYYALSCSQWSRQGHHTDSEDTNGLEVLLVFGCVINNDCKMDCIFDLWALQRDLS